ncbi:family 20 glycosylhydrolase [Peijinzhouia sedimentorum]
MRKLTLFILIAALVACQNEAPKELPIAIIPLPQQISTPNGTYKIPANPRVYVQDEEAKRIIQLFLDASGTEADFIDDPQKSDWQILISDDATDTSNEEAYELDIYSNALLLQANSHAGLFYGVQSLLQLLPANEPAQYLPLLSISDSPAFSWRGMHLDVARHFFEIDFIKKYLDMMAMYKMNRFHWHLTEDQGWRIEIKKYPLLTEKGAWRDETLIGHYSDQPHQFDGKRYGGFYTQEQVKEIVAYAAERYITVVPEIEMPGHATAALYAYPEFANDEGPDKVTTLWGVFEDIFSPKEETFVFLEDVLNEVMDLFPGEYIHIGGDEAPKVKWKESQYAQELIKREGLADEFELQSWFIRRVEKIINARGKKLLGWDEILEGGLSPTATVMSWRGEAGGIEAAKHGNDVVMTPGFALYFDHYQGDPQFEPTAIGGLSTLANVYSYHPIPAELSSEEQSHILGAQANVWTEYIPTSDHVEYMVFPRMLALSEVVWSGADKKNYEDFQSRLAYHLPLLDAKNINYRLPEPIGLGGNMVQMESSFELNLQSILPNAEIRYTLDGTLPDANSTLYTEPVAIDIPIDASLKVMAIAISEDGRQSAPAIGTFTRQDPLPGVQVEDVKNAFGLTAQYFKQNFRTVSQLADAEPVTSYKLTIPQIPAEVTEAVFGLKIDGIFVAKEAGIYEFELTSDDGSMLKIGNREVINHDGLHGSTARNGQIALEEGNHPIQILYFDAGGGYGLKLRVKEPSGTWREVTEDDFH